MISLSDLEKRVSALEAGLLRLIEGSAALAEQQGEIASRLGQLGEEPSAQLQYLQFIVFELGRALEASGALAAGALGDVLDGVENDILDDESLTLAGFTRKTFNLWVAR